MAVTGDDLRRVMAKFATGITVVLARDPENHDNIFGMTVNSFTSVSLTPPQVLVCVGRQRFMHGILTGGGPFSISILSEPQAAVSQYFAGQREPDLEQAVRYRELQGGLPGIEGALGWLECKLAAVYPGGDHDIVLAEVTGVEVGEPANDAAAAAAAKAAGVADGAALARPLLFFNSRYRRMAPEEEA